MTADTFTTRWHVDAFLPTDSGGFRRLIRRGVTLELDRPLSRLVVGGPVLLEATTAEVSSVQRARTFLNPAGIRIDLSNDVWYVFFRFDGRRTVELVCRACEDASVAVRPGVYRFRELRPAPDAFVPRSPSPPT
jgi:hypothetical protein